MKRNFYRWFAAVAMFVLFAVILTRSLAGAPSHPPARQAKAAATSPHVTQENGHVVVYLNSKSQARLAISKSPLKAARERKRMTLPATVLSVQNLASLVSAYDAADAQLQKAEITARVTKREYMRLKKLYREDQNVSQKAVQAAAGVYRGNEVDVQLARQKLSLGAEAVLQNWGEAITGWMGHDTNRLQRVLRREDVLIEMTVPAGESFAAPSSVDFKLPAGGRAFARFVSAFPQVDPRVQGVGYLYVTRSHPGLAPGFDLIAHFGVGALRSGVIVPSSAVVWLHGEAWAYVATGPDRFVRQQVSTGVPVPGGWFVRHGFAPGSSVVTRDAEQVLAVELITTQPSLGNAGEGDD